MRKYKKKKNTISYLTIITFLLIFLISNIFNYESNQIENSSKPNQELNQTTPVIKNNDDTDTNPEIKNENELTNQNNEIKIHFIDVGQGDSIFIELPDKETMLIDAGESSQKVKVQNYITSLEYNQINYLIGTHPHTDHIGSLAYIIENFTIDNIYMPKASSTSKTYENLLETISKKGLKVKTAKSGVNIINTNDLKIDIIAPNSETYSDLNNYSAVIKITYKNRKFLFMGDAETKSEDEILDDISVDVIKIGHHGSNTSSSQSFVNKVKPKYAIISVGANNKYNHPYQTILDRWTNVGATIYRTDINGNIVVTSDGTSLDIKLEK